MGLFGSSKIKIAPSDFVKAQLDKIFSSSFIDAEKKNFERLSQEFVFLQRVNPDKYLNELQYAIHNLFEIAWDRNSPFDMFGEKDFDMRYNIRSIISDDPRVKTIDNEAYDFSLSKAQQAGMDTFGYIATVFFDLVRPQDVDINDADIIKLIEVYEGSFTNLYLGYEKLIKKQRFIT